MKIVSKTQLDLVPKITMHLLIDDVKNFMKTDLLPTLYALDTSRLMEESQEEKRRKQDMVTMYNTMKEALNIIADVTTHTVTTPVPPPITNDWRESDAAGGGSPRTSNSGPSRPNIVPNRNSPSLPAMGPGGGHLAPQARNAPPAPPPSRPSNSSAPPPPLVPARTAPLIPQPAVHPSNSAGDLFAPLSSNSKTTANASSTPTVSWNSNPTLKMFDPIASSTSASTATNNGAASASAGLSTRALASLFENRMATPSGPPIPPRPN
uniref:GED domain-containing protein n=1 Tax=Mesocestoides corti TaxID=53468 RepID=A0A5K3F5D9_MESCO